MGRYRAIVVDPPWPVEGPAIRRRSGGGRLARRQVHPGWDGWGDQYDGTSIDWDPCPTRT